MLTVVARSLRSGLIALGCTLSSAFTDNKTTKHQVWVYKQCTNLSYVLWYLRIILRESYLQANIDICVNTLGGHALVISCYKNCNIYYHNHNHYQSMVSCYFNKLLMIYLSTLLLINGEFINSSLLLRQCALAMQFVHYHCNFKRPDLWWTIQFLQQKLITNLYSCLMKPRCHQHD